MHDDDCSIAIANLVIDDSRLAPLISVIEKSFSIENTPYILDIDLDVFNTRAAISPPRSDLFRRLIHHAELITIAREKDCVENLGNCCLEPGLTAQYLETLLLEHIESA
jgi:hypothetical protein